MPVGLSVLLPLQGKRSAGKGSSLTIGGHWVCAGCAGCCCCVVGVAATSPLSPCRSQQEQGRECKDASCRHVLEVAGVAEGEGNEARALRLALALIYMTCGSLLLVPAKSVTPPADTLSLGRGPVRPAVTAANGNLSWLAAGGPLSGPRHRQESEGATGGVSRRRPYARESVPAPG